MNSVTNKYIWFKCYLNLFKLVADRMRSLIVLAMLLNNFNAFFGFKKIIRKCYYFLLTVHTNSLSMIDTFHRSLSLSPKCRAWTISTGTVVRNDFECDVCKFTVDSNSNNFITPFLLFFVNIFDNIL